MKIFQIITMLLFSVTIAFSQSIRIAPVVGTNVTITQMSKTYKDEMEETIEDLAGSGTTLKVNYPPVVKFQLGALADYHLNENIAFQSGLLFHLRGFKMKLIYQDLNNNEASGKMEYNLSYMEVPLTASFRVNESGFRIFAGPGLGFALGGKAKMKIGSNQGNNYDESEKLEVGSDVYTGDILPFDLSLIIGLGKEFEVGGSNMAVSAFLQPSLTKWNTQSKISNDYTLRHVTAGIRLAYFINLR